MNGVQKQAMSEIYQSKGNYEEALAMLNQTITLDEQNAMAFFSRSQIYDLMGHYQEALANLDLAIILDKNVQYIHFRGLMLGRLGQYAKATETLKQVLNKRPNDYRALYNLATVIVRWKGISEAQLYIHKARTEINKRKADSQTLYALGGLAALYCNSDQALDYLQQAVQLQGKIAQKFFEDRLDKMVRHDLAWLDLRDGPRFQAIIAE